MTISDTNAFGDHISVAAPGTMRQALKPSTFIRFAPLLLVFHFIGYAPDARAQCNNTTPYGSATAPAPGNSVTITTVQYAGEFATINGVAASTPYQSTSSVATDFFTVRQGTPAGPVIAFGVQPLNWTSTVAGDYYIHCNTDATCGLQNTDRVHTLSAPSNTPMAFASCTTTQNNTTAITNCSFTDKEIIGIRIVTTGSITPLSATSFTLRTNGTTSPLSDIATVKVYYTGNASSFDAVDFFGFGETAASGIDIVITGSQALLPGANHFWVTYDLNPTIPVGNVLDARCTSMIVASTAHAPSTTAPAGSRTMVACPPSPGAVDNNILLWLKPDAGLTTSSGNVIAWGDQSTAATSVIVYGSPDLVAAGRNYNANVLFTKSNFAGDGGDYLRTGDINVRSFFCAARLQDTMRESTHILTYDGVSQSAPCPGCAIHGGNNGSGRAEYGEVGYGSAHFQAAGVWRKNGSATGTTYQTHHSGNFDIVSALGTGLGSANVLLGGQDDYYPFNGRLRDWVGPVGELILYAGPITTTEANRIESYLAMKYGITLGGNGSSTLAYVSSAGTTVWAAASGYHNDVIGIARDDNSAFLQKQSHAPDDTSRLYLNTLAATNSSNTATFTNNGAFVLMGRNTGKVCATAASNLERPAGTTSRLEREWKVTNTGFDGSFNWDVKLNACAIPGMVNPADLRLLVDDDGDFTNATVLAAGGGLGFAYNAGVVSVTGISTSHIPQNGTRYITIGSMHSSTPLPIELVAFNADCNGNTVVVDWSTASEHNNASFTVERSRDGSDFLPMTIVPGAGNSSAMVHYSWVDDAPARGLAYYRLKQTDQNGTSTYSDLVPVHCVHWEDLSIFPNPAATGFYVDLVSQNSTDPVELELQNVTGQLILQRLYPIAVNVPARIPVNIQGVSEGVYFVRLSQGGMSRTFKLTVIK